MVTGTHLHFNNMILGRKKISKAIEEDVSIAQSKSDDCFAQDDGKGTAPLVGCFTSYPIYSKSPEWLTEE
ncbi:hypothetical protein CB1_064113011 [Camelus ferus]|nr:hypothetical protein CB1_064113011 [Camelus ferus]